jgi:hypothetical protein
MSPGPLSVIERRRNVLKWLLIKNINEILKNNPGFEILWRQDPSNQANWTKPGLRFQL